MTTEPLTRWPTVADYEVAIIAAEGSAGDALISGLRFDRSMFDMPTSETGSAGYVFSARAGRKRFAFKVFSKHVPNRRERYQHIHAHLSQQPSESFVGFEFSDNGIWVHDDRDGGHWFPAVRMEWCAGRPLDVALGESMRNGYDPHDWVRRFLALVHELRRTRTVHGDLQHGNILVADDGSVRLVDYDGMYVPSMKGKFATPERGHPAYQHPNRQAGGALAAEHMDTISILVILTSLAGLTAELWAGRDDEGIVLTPDDLRDPVGSLALAQLAQGPDPAPELARLLRDALDEPTGRHLEVAAKLYGVDLPRIGGRFQRSADPAPPADDPGPVFLHWDPAVRVADPPPEPKRTPATPSAAASAALELLLANAVSLRSSGRLPKSLAKCESAVSLARNDARAHVQLGWTCLAFKTGHRTTALAAFDAAVALDPESAEALAGRGIARLLRGHYVEARISFEQAVRIDPKQAEAVAGQAALAARTATAAAMRRLHATAKEARETHVMNHVVEFVVAHPAPKRRSSKRRPLARPTSANPPAPTVPDSESVQPAPRTRAKKTKRAPKKPSGATRAKPAAAKHKPPVTATAKPTPAKRKRPTPTAPKPKSAKAAQPTPAASKPTPANPSAAKSPARMDAPAKRLETLMRQLGGSSFETTPWIPSGRGLVGARSAPFLSDGQRRVLFRDIPQGTQALWLGMYWAPGDESPRGALLVTDRGLFWTPSKVLLYQRRAIFAPWPRVAELTANASGITIKWLGGPSLVISKITNALALEPGWQQWTLQGFVKAMEVIRHHGMLTSPTHRHWPNLGQ